MNYIRGQRPIAHFNINLGEGYTLKIIRNNPHFTLLIAYHSIDIGHVDWITDEVDVAFITLINIASEHLKYRFANQHSLGELILNKISQNPSTGIKYKFSFMLHAPESVHLIVKKFHGQNRSHDFIRKNLMCCDQLRLPEQKAYFPRIKIELLTIAIPRIKILDLLQLNTYWQNHLTLEALTMLIANSQCFLATQGETIIGFARVLSDGDNFASLWDVVVDKKYQGQGIGKNMIHHIFIHTLYNNIKKWLLFTDTAHKLYRRFGFAMVSESANHMITMI